MSVRVLQDTLEALKSCFGLSNSQKSYNIALSRVRCLYMIKILIY